LEACTLPSVSPAALSAVTSRELYRHWTTDFPPPKIESRLPLLPWPSIWRRLEGLAVNIHAQDVHFSLLHNILPLPTRLHRLQLRPDAACGHCGVPLADTLHTFTACPRVLPAWAYLFAKASLALGVVLSDEDLLFLAWDGPSAAAQPVVAAVLAYTFWVWETRSSPAPLHPPSLRQRVEEDLAAAAAPVRSIFG
jgi:hypothetical protein